MNGPALLGDGDDRRLLSRVRPDGWSNPAPAPLYDLVVIGGGTAGLVSAFLAAALGARTALVERALLGGDCLVTGCVPSKALLASARAAAAARGAGELGVAVGDVRPDGAAALARMRRLRADVAEHDAASRLAAAGIDLFFGEARFTGPAEAAVAGAALRFRRCILATGAEAAVPPVPGLAESGYLTNDTVFALADVPASLLVLGGGPIGCELAQAFARLGSRVTLAQRGERLLPRDDEDASSLVALALQRDGVDVRLQTEVARVDGKRSVLRCGLGGEETLETEAILVAAGRRGRAGGLGLQAAGVETTEDGFVVADDRLRTANRRILVAGDAAAGRPQFTHAADAMARVAVQNALLPVRRSVESLVIPWCTYTEPEVAHVGAAAGEARRLGLMTVTASLADVDRAIVDGATAGFARLHVHPRTGRIHGATVVGPHAGETIAEAALAIRAGVSAGTLEDTIHCYPTHSESLRRAAAAWRRTRLRPWMPTLLRRWYRLLR